jgi:hypothetical protein
MLGQPLDFRFDGRFNFSQFGLLAFLDDYEMSVPAMRGFLKNKTPLILEFRSIPRPWFPKGIYTFWKKLSTGNFQNKFEGIIVEREGGRGESA